MAGETIAFLPHARHIVAALNLWLWEDNQFDEYGGWCPTGKPSIVASSFKYLQSSSPCWVNTFRKYNGRPYWFTFTRHKFLAPSRSSNSQQQYATDTMRLPALLHARFGCAEHMPDVCPAGRSNCRGHINALSFKKWPYYDPTTAFLLPHKYMDEGIHVIAWSSTMKCVLNCSSK